MMWDLMLPECFSCFTIVSSEWERVTGGQRRERERFVGGRNLCVCDRAGKKGRLGQQETEGVQCMCECVRMQLDEKWSVD